MKSRMTPGHADYHHRHEPILYGYGPGDVRPGRGGRTGSRWYGGHNETSVLEFPRPAASRDHPTAKPVGLVERCLRNSTTEGDLVFDPFAGSGSTIIAAERLGRPSAAIELDPRYAAVAIRRWEAFTGRTAVRRG